MPKTTKSSSYKGKGKKKSTSYYKKKTPFYRPINQSDRSQVCVRVPVKWQYAYVTKNNNYGYSDVYPFVPFYYYSKTGSGPNYMLPSSGLYRTFAALFEQVRLLGATYRIKVLSPVGGTNAPSLTLMYAFDRFHAYEEPMPNFSSGMNGAPGVRTRVMAYNDRQGFRISVWARDMQERCTWHDAFVSDTLTSCTDQAYYLTGRNCPFFCPCLFFGVRNSYYDTDVAITISFECNYYVMFRNAKTYDYLLPSSSQPTTKSADPVRELAEEEGLNPDDPSDLREMEDALAATQVIEETPPVAAAVRTPQVRVRVPVTSTSF